MTTTTTTTDNEDDVDDDRQLGIVISVNLTVFAKNDDLDKKLFFFVEKLKILSYKLNLDFLYRL